MDDVPFGIMRSLSRAERQLRVGIGTRGSKPGDGWTHFPATWTYASASSFTITDDFTGDLLVGDRLKLTQGATVKYFEVTACSYSDPNTTVTVAGPVALTNAEITDTFTSKIWNPAGFPYQGAPKRATMFHEEALIVAGNAIVNALDNLQRHNTVSYQSTAANGDSFTHGCFLAAGVYTFFVLGFTGTDRGKVDWTLDGVSIAAGQDWYAASGARNVVKSVSSIVVPFSGWHVLQGTVNGKTGSPGGYLVELTKYWLRPEAD